MTPLIVTRRTAEAVRRRSIGSQRKDADMSSVLPKDHHDLSLAPVAVSIDRNLQGLRDIETHAILVALEVVLDRPERTGRPQERADRILEAVLRNVDLHGWTAHVTSDFSRIRLTGGSVTLDIGLSATLLRFIEGEMQAEHNGSRSLSSDC
jgi:hypothetical protein